MGASFSCSKNETRQLIDACSRGLDDEVRQLLTDNHDLVITSTFWKHRTPLMLAAKQGNILTVSSILWAAEQALGQDFLSYLNDVDNSGATALMLAAKHGHVHILNLLLEEGANPLIANQSRGQTAAHVAAHRGHADCLEVVLDAPVRTIGGARPVAAMAPIRDQTGLESRFIDAHDRLGLAAIHLAALSKDAASVAVLIQRGATLDIPVLRGLERLTYLSGGSTALHIAAAQGDVRTCIVLLEGQWRYPGVELRRVRNLMGLTPLNCALLHGYHEAARVLVEIGRRPRSQSLTADIFSQTILNGRMNNAFPDSLREHMKTVLQRALLALQLKEIAGKWKTNGVAQASDDEGMRSFPGLNVLSKEQVERLLQLVQRRETTLREMLMGIEVALEESGVTSQSSIGRQSSDRSDILSGGGLHESGFLMHSLGASSASSGRRRTPRERRRSSGRRASNIVDRRQQERALSEEKSGENGSLPEGKKESVCMPGNGEDCAICMDASGEVAFMPCQHSTCFNCACRLCTQTSGEMTCPFCRQGLSSVVEITGIRGNKGEETSGVCVKEGMLY